MRTTNESTYLEIFFKLWFYLWKKKKCNYISLLYYEYNVLTIDVSQTKIINMIVTNKQFKYSKTQRQTISMRY